MIVEKPDFYISESEFFELCQEGSLAKLVMLDDAITDRTNIGFFVEARDREGRIYFATISQKSRDNLYPLFNKLKTQNLK